MSVFNAIINFVFGLLFIPFRGMNPWVGLIALSVISGVFLLWVFKITSDQAAISAAKNRLRGYLLEIRLFQDDPGIVFSAFGRILLNNAIYMRYALAPMLFMIIPVVLFLVQADMRFGVAPVEPGEKFMVSVVLDEKSKGLLDDMELEIPEGVEIAAGPVIIPSESEIAWELVVHDEKNHEIVLSVGEDKYKHPLIASGDGKRIARARVSGSAMDKFMNSGYPPLPKNSPVKKIEIDYPHLELKIAGITIHWLITFIVVSIVFGYSVKGLFGVEI
ncbi:hypothetical protein ACFLQK_00560 [bacterium]